MASNLEHCARLALPCHSAGCESVRLSFARDCSRDRKLRGQWPKSLRVKVDIFAGLESELHHSIMMKYLWPRTNAAIRNVLATIVFLAGFSGVLAWCAVTSASRVIPGRPPLAQLERTLRRVPSHISEFSPASAPLALPKCGNVRPPEALLTPDPLLRVKEDHLRVRVSFIVGGDGHVYSAFILESGGPEEDQIVLHAVRFWRYRPALCNGVPTDSEALVRFSIR